jgi:hypothetical protein
MFVVIAASAALVLIGTSSARATMVSFDIDIAQSSMTISQTWNLTEIGAGIHTTTPQSAGSDTTRLYGTLLVDLTPTTIDIGAGGTSSTISFESTGDYAPFDPVTSDPTPPLGVTPDANYGLQISALSMRLVEYELEAYLASGGPVALAGGAFPLLPGVDFMIGKNGRVAFYSAIGADTEDVVGDPLAAFGTAGFTPGTWDGGVLTIPIESSFTIAQDTGSILPGSQIYLTFSASGVIVATPSVVPEPSALALLGFGVGGFLVRLRRSATRA